MNATGKNLLRATVAITLALGVAGCGTSKMTTGSISKSSGKAVEQMSATYAFKANLQTIKAQEEMMGSLLDVKA